MCCSTSQLPTLFNNYFHCFRLFNIDGKNVENYFQAEWKCVATNDYGQSVTSSFVKLNIPKHYKKPKFLEDLKAVMSEEGAVNLECKVNFLNINLLNYAGYCCRLCRCLFQFSF